MSDSKYFTTTKRGKIQELRAELINEDKKKKKVAMKRIVANMTLGNDMSDLFQDVLQCIQVPDSEIKKMVYLYVINYAKLKPDLATNALSSFARDSSDPNPLIRALAIRTMGYIQVEKTQETIVEPLRRALRDSDAYVRKTAATGVAKFFALDSNAVFSTGLIESLKDLVNDANPTVVANAIASLTEIMEKSSKDVNFNMNMLIVNKLLTALNECNEWGQAYILESLMNFVPVDPSDAETVCERVAPRMQHANSAVVLTAIKVVIYQLNFVQNEEFIALMRKKLSPPLVTLLSSGPEVQYVALRNILVILQKYPDLLKNDIKVFFCKYYDPVYVKLSKLEIMIRLTNEKNVDQVLPELKEYAAEVDVDFVRKSVRAIGRCAISIEKAAERCIEALVELIQTKVNYVVQEAIVVIKDIFRKYPNRYESIISTLCENLDSLDEPEAKASMIWIIGQYADRIENAGDLLQSFLDNFADESSEVQLSLLTATVKLFLKRPSVGQPLVPKVLKWSTEESDNPDLRDRGFIYWRLLSTDPAAAKAVVLSEKPLISTETDRLDPALVEELLLHIASLASIYHKPPASFIGGVKLRKLPDFLSLPRDFPEEAKDAPPAVDYNPYSNEGNAIYQNPTDMIGKAGNQQMDNLLDLDLDLGPTQGGYGGNAVGAQTYGGYGGNVGYGGYGIGIGAGDATTGANPFGAPTQQSSGGYPLAANNPFGAPAGPANASNPFGGVSGVPSAPGSARPITGDFGTGFGTPVSGAQNPFGGSSAVGGGFGGLEGLSGLAITSDQGYVQPKAILLSAHQGKGLEIKGTYSRRQAGPQLEITLSNKALAPLSNFDIKMNKNTFSLALSSRLEINALLPNQSVDAVLRFSPGGVRAPMDPLNNLQFAVNNSVGLHFFNAPIPLYILFAEDGLMEKGAFLNVWRDIPATLERTVDFANISGYSSSVEIKNKLQANNLFTVAERQVENKNMFYLSAKIPDGITFLAELSADQSLRNFRLAVKTQAVDFIPFFIQSVELVLRSISASASPF